MSDDEEWIEQPVFVGTCVCEHGQYDHGWGECSIGDCECAAGWEE